MNGSSAEIESELVDLTGVTLEALRTYDNDRFASMVRRVLDRVDRAEGSISGYNGTAPVETPSGTRDSAYAGEDRATPF